MPLGALILLVIGLIGVIVGSITNYRLHIPLRKIDWFFIAVIAVPFFTVSALIFLEAAGVIDVGLEMTNYYKKEPDGGISSYILHYFFKAVRWLFGTG